MDTLEFLLLGIVIALNNLAFSFSMGALGTRRYHLRIVLVFALVEFTVPLAGLFVGRFLRGYIEEYAQITGSVVLIGLGLFTVFSAFRGHKRREASVDILASVKGLFIIALGLSLDNLFVGFSLGLGEVNPLLLAGYIAICSAVFTFAGLKLGRYIKYSFGKYVEVFAGLVLIVLGLINF